MTAESSTTAVSPVKNNPANFGVPGTPAVRTQDPDGDTAGDASAQKKQEQLLLFLQKREEEKQNKEKKTASLSGAEKTLLGNMTAQGNRTAFTVSENGKQIASVDPGGVNYEFRQSDKKEDIEHNIDACVKSGLVYKASFGNEVEINGRTELETLMLAKSASLIGVKVLNPPDKTLEQVNPQLARQMDDWAKAHGLTPKPAEKYDSKTDLGLVTAPSSLDIPNRQLAQNFNQAVNCIGYAMIKGLPNLVGHEGEKDEPAALVVDTQGNKQFMTEKVLAERIEGLENGSPLEKTQANQFRSVLETLQEKVANGADLGAPIADASQFKPAVVEPSQTGPQPVQTAASPRQTAPNGPS